jgi:hypothetical protein
VYNSLSYATAHNINITAKLNPKCIDVCIGTCLMYWAQYISSTYTNEGRDYKGLAPNNFMYGIVGLWVLNLLKGNK